MSWGYSYSAILLITVTILDLAIKNQRSSVKSEVISSHKSILGNKGEIPQNHVSMKAPLCLLKLKLFL
jgi:hypothetical protein